MNVQAFLDEIRADPDYAGQIVYVREVPARTARFAAREDDPSTGLGDVLARIGVERLYSHQAEAWRHVRNGKNVVVSTGTASGKTLCYALPLIELLARKWDLPNLILIVYELNGPIRFLRDGDRAKLRDAWLKWRTGLDSNELAIKKMLAAAKIKAELAALSSSFDANVKKAAGAPTGSVAVRPLSSCRLLCRPRTSSTSPVWRGTCCRSKRRTSCSRATASTTAP